MRYITVMTIRTDNDAQIARDVQSHRESLLNMLVLARDLMPNDAMSAELDASEQEWLFDCMRLLRRLAAQCDVELTPYGWWSRRSVPPNFEKFKVVMQRVTTKALSYSVLDLKFIV